MTAEIGRVLGGRYRLVAPIGMGASAQVYLADDVKLRRRVAVKMLHDALAGDAEFLRRFRAEARAAAALSHPNVMAVYDWSDGSEDGEAAFIVTEYLPGGSLRALLDSGALLTPSQALGVGLEAARALDYAHRRGFVHRDIKPANLLFGEDQRLRIADFGLARALAEAAWTEPQGAMLGTARYASPEQAKGETLSGKGDVYSLALVLVESVTGEVPFTADTTLGTLMARVDRPLVVPDALGPLQAIVAQAGLADPDARIDARTLAKGLLRVAHELSRPAPLPLVGALAAGTLAGDDLDPTVHAPALVDPALAATANDLTADDLELEPPAWVNQPDTPGLLAAAAAAGTLASDDGDDTLVVEPEPEREPVVDLTRFDDVAPEAAAPVGATTPEPVTDEVAVLAADGDDLADGDDGRHGDDGDGTTRRRRWPWVALVLLVILAFGGGAYAVATNASDKPSGPAVVLPVPNLVGRTEAQAKVVAQASGWKTVTVTKRQDGSKKGEVLATKPAAGTRLPDGRTIVLTVSAGQTYATVPTDLAGKTLDAATQELKDAGLGAATVDTPYSEDVPKGSVVGVQEGTAPKLEKGTAVPLVVSNGPKPRTIPGGLVGSSEADATAALDALGLKAAIVRTYSDTVPKGTVISVLPKSGSTVEKGSSVSVEVSRGPELVAVPDVSGAASISEAVSILSRAGLQAGTVSGPAAGSPQGTRPGAGSMVAPGSSVNIILG